MKKIFTIVLLLTAISWGQPWTYDFGTGTGNFSTANTVSVDFLPDPPSGTDRVRIGTAGGSFNLDNPGSSLGTNTELRGVAATSASANKFSVYDFSSPSTSMTIHFLVRFGGGSSGIWLFSIGNGAVFNDNNSLSSTFTSSFNILKWTFAASDAITTEYRNGANWSTISGTPFAQNTNYYVDIYCNNQASGSISYTYGTSQSVASGKWDLWVNGVLIGDELNKPSTGIGTGTTLDSYLFDGESSTSNVANIYIDDIYYTNGIPANPIPVELTSFTAKQQGSNVTLNWNTATEVRNHGFEIERVKSEELRNNNWSKVGFVSGNGNSNIPHDYTFTDNTVKESGKYIYRLKQIDTDGSFEYSNQIEVNVEIPKTYSLLQNYPNPFNPVTTIQYSIAAPENVVLKIYDITGKEVLTLVNEKQDAGKYEVKLDASKLASGTYIYRLSAGSFVQTKKMILLK